MRRIHGNDGRSNGRAWRCFVCSLRWQSLLQVAGAGTVLSPQGAFKRAPLRSGKATFSLIAPVTAAARTAGIPARLQFDLPGLSLRSEQLRFLGQQGTQRVFAGSGLMRGAGTAQFRLATGAGLAGVQPGRFALKIWHTDPASGTEVLVYDNTAARPGAEAGGVVDGGIAHE